jgi:hypothetical protein
MQSFPFRLARATLKALGAALHAEIKPKLNGNAASNIL